MSIKLIVYIFYKWQIFNTVSTLPVLSIERCYRVDSGLCFCALLRSVFYIIKVFCFSIPCQAGRFIVVVAIFYTFEYYLNSNVYECISE